MDWKRTIAVAYKVKQKVAEVDVNRLWDYHLPGVAASEASVSAAEHAMGFHFDAEYREFLKHADGWRSFFQAVDILSTEDLLGTARYQKGMDLLKSLNDVKTICGVAQSHVFPVAVSADDIDAFFMAKPSSGESGRVFWFAGQLVDSFPSFGEWFLSMVDYNRREYHRLSNNGI